MRQRPPLSGLRQTQTPSIFAGLAVICQEFGRATFSSTLAVETCGLFGHGSARLGDRSRGGNARVGARHTGGSQTGTAAHLMLAFDLTIRQHLVLYVDCIAKGVSIRVGGIFMTFEAVLWFILFVLKGSTEDIPDCSQYGCFQLLVLVFIFCSGELLCIRRHENRQTLPRFLLPPSVSSSGSS